MKYSPFRHLSSVLFKTKPIQLTVFLTKRCNARCNFCFYLSQNDKTSLVQELSLTEIEKIADGFGDLLWFAFSGGEIFLRKDLPEIAEIFYQRNRPAIILLPTNGLLPDTIYKNTESILKKCPKSTVVVKVSVDGDKEVHDKLRGVHGAYEKAMQTYGKLEKLLERHDNFELGINTVFCAENQDRALSHIKTIREIETCKTHTVSLIRGSVDDDTQKDICLETYSEVIYTLAENLQQNSTGRYRFNGGRLKAAQDILQRRLIEQTVAEDKQVIPCYAGKLTMVITENGDVYPCESFEGKLANLREIDFDFEELFRSKRYLDTVRNIKLGKCYCHHECYMMMNILFNPRQYPALLKEYISL